MLFAMALLLAGASSAVTYGYVDTTPPSGWVQCAGFTNTVGDDIDTSFMNDCLGADALLLRMWDKDGNLEDDVYAKDLPKLTAWLSWSYLGGSVLNVGKSTYWVNSASGSVPFFTSTNGQDACLMQAAPSGLTFGTGSSSTGIIVAGATGEYELRVNCGGSALLGRTVAIYKYSKPSPSKYGYADPSPPYGWVQCAGFVNTAGDDIGSNFMDDCLNGKGLRVRVWNSAGILEDDVYDNNIATESAWSSKWFGPFGFTAVASTNWPGGLFRTSTYGSDTCDQQSAPSGLTFGVNDFNWRSKGNSGAIIAAANTGYDEYRISCGGSSLPDRKIAVYKLYSFPVPGPSGKCAASAAEGLNSECCTVRGYQWVKSGEQSAGVNSQFSDSSGERKAPASKQLLQNEERCSSGDASEQFPLRTRQCSWGTCASDQSDKAVCDKSTDCVFNGKCFSDIKTVASTFFGGTAIASQAAVWQSNWKNEVSVDVDADGKLEVCDPGQWLDPKGNINGTVTDSTTGARISGAWINAVGTSNPALEYVGMTAVEGNYTISDIEPVNYDITASKEGYKNSTRNNVPVLPFQTTQIDFQLEPGGQEGAWGADSASVTGAVRNITNDPVPGAVVRILGTAFSATTAADGTYSIADVPFGTYDLVASKPSDGYEDAASLGISVNGDFSADFVLLRASAGCNDDCTKEDGFCHSECGGKGLCSFASPETASACDMAVPGIITDPSDPSKQITCCTGASYAPVKADVKIICGDNVISVRMPVLFRGRIVSMVVTTFNPGDCEP